jgi:pimeloyl-ACP methyl ester carboxylesterase
MPDIVTRRYAANGLSFAVDEAGNGDTVALLLHGFPECRAAWRRQLPALAELGWRAAAPDMRGYGETARPSGLAAYRMERLVEDVEALFTALGARRRILIGHDWGGVIAWQAALRGRPALDGLVVLNAPHPLVFERALRGWEQRLRSWYVLFFLLPLLPELQLRRREGRSLAKMLRRQSSRIPEDLLELYRRNTMAPGAASAMVNYYRANALSLSRAASNGETVRVPTLMIWGEDDFALSLALTEGNEAYVNDFTLRRLPGVSHWAEHEAPEEIAAAISAWAAAKGLGA